MNITKLLLSIGAVSLLSTPFAHAASLPVSPKIDKFVLKQFKTRAQVNRTVFVVLKKQSDLTAADSIKSRDEKASYVYDTLRTTALSTQNPIVNLLKDRGVSYRQFYIENMIAVYNPSMQLINELAARDDVARIMGNPIVKLRLPKQHLSMGFAKDGGNGPEQSLERVGATKVWEEFKDKGEGIVIAGQDTGVQWDHPAIKHQYRGYAKDGKIDHNYNWHDAIHGPLTSTADKASCGFNSQVPCDDQGHGTHTIGTIVGDDGHGNQIGVAPKAKWVACKNMDRGFGSPASYIECFEYFLAPYPLGGNPLTDGKPEKAPHIINNSWGCTAEEGCNGDEILPALQSMKKAGIFVVASAGNNGPSCSTIDDPPAWHTGLAFTIGAFDHRNDQIAYFSSRGPSQADGGVGPNISAPGVSIRSAYPGNQYTRMSGTSMAGPHAVGVAALLWSYDNSLIGNIDKSISILENSAEAKTSMQSCGGIPGSSIPNNTYGYGFINIEKAIKSIQ